MSDPKPNLSRAQADLEAWKTWKGDPTEQHLLEVMERMQGVVNKTVSKWSAAPVPTPAIRAMANVHLKKAIDNYDPAKGASLATYAEWNLKKTGTFVHRYQNVGRMPDHRIEKISDFKIAKTELSERLGHPPDAKTLVDHLGPKWSVNEVSRMEKELQSDHVASLSMETDLLAVPVSAKELDAMRYIVDDLSSPEERLVYEYSMGLNGKPKLSAQEIAKRMNKSGPWVSRTRGKIDQKLRSRWSV